VRSAELLASDPCDGDGWTGTPVLAGGLPPRTCRLPERGVTRGCGGVEPERNSGAIQQGTDTACLVEKAAAPSSVGSQVEVQPTNGLIRHARHARPHSDDQAAQIAGFGFTTPILIGGDDVIIARQGQPCKAFAAR